MKFPSPTGNLRTNDRIFGHPEPGYFGIPIRVSDVMPPHMIALVGTTTQVIWCDLLAYLTLKFGRPPLYSRYTVGEHERARHERRKGAR